MDSVSLVYWGFAAFIVVTLIIRLPRLWRARRNPMLWWMSVSLLLGATTMSLAAPAAIAWINRASGVTNLAAPLVYDLIVCLSASIPVMLLFWRAEAGAGRKARLWLLVYGCVAAAVPLLFVRGHTPVERRVDFDTYYARSPYIREMIVAYLIAFAVAAITLGHFC